MTNNDRVYYSHNAEIQVRREIIVLTTLTLTLGLGIGAMLALLFAPSSGEKARHNLVQGIEEEWGNDRDTVDPMVKRLEEKFGEMLKNVEERVTHLT
ncbi:MAG: YtxH domain-containing protein [Anaerolineae bacterium]|nr:YtxH domain-containing protein [Anaerolineae bacterium]